MDPRPFCEISQSDGRDEVSASLMGKEYSSIFGKPLAPCKDAKIQAESSYASLPFCMLFSSEEVTAERTGLPVPRNLSRSLPCRPAQARLPSAIAAFACHSSAQDEREVPQRVRVPRPLASGSTHH